jgi:hypothetical protein
MGHWNGDRNCEPAQLTEVSARGGTVLRTDVPQPSDRIGAYTTEQFEQMNPEFTAAVERAFRSGDKSEMAAAATYDLRRR